MEHDHEYHSPVTCPGIWVTDPEVPSRDFWTGATFPPAALDIENSGIPGAEWYRVCDSEQKKNGIPVRDYAGEKWSTWS